MTLRREQVQYRDGWEQSVHCMHRHLRASEEGDFAFSDTHYHEYVELLYGLQGTAQVLIGDRVYAMREGELAIVNAGEAHTVACREGEARYYVIKFLPKILYSQSNTIAVVRYLFPLWQKEVAFSPVFSREELCQSKMDVRLQEILRESEERKEGYDLLVQASIMQLFVWMVRRLRPSQTQLEAELSGTLTECVYRVLEEIQKNPTDVTAASAARFCNLSYGYFCRSFKKALGISFSAYLESVRLREGERLLLTTDLEVTEVAQRVGFGTTSYFIERFRKRYGLPPRVFRAQMRGFRASGRHQPEL